jgi:hypothetical protein
MTSCRLRAPHQPTRTIKAWGLFFVTLLFLANRGAAVSVKIRLLSVFIRVEAVDLPWFR